MSVHFTLSDVDPEIPLRKEALGEVRFKPFSTHFLSKKRKVEELYDLETPASNLMMATDIMIDRYSEKVEAVDNLIADQKKNALKLEKAKRKIKALKAILAAKSSHSTEEGTSTNNTLLAEMKRDATIAVLESKIHMATEAAENGLDASLWDVRVWKDKLAKMKDDFPSNRIGLGGSRAKGKATKAPTTRSSSTSDKGEASNPAKIAVAVDVVDSEGSSG